MFVLCMCALALTGQAHEVAVAWDPGTPVGLVSGYRLHRGNESGIYTESLDVGPATTATISGLIAGETYYFAVTAYGPSGDESRYSAEAVWTAPEYIWLEAEQAELSGGFAEEQTVSASAGTYIRAPLDEASQAVFDFEARGGQYYVWALVAADGADHDSDNYLGTIDSGLEDVWTLDRETQPCHSNGWSWAGIHGSSDPALQVGSTRFSVALEEGPHTLRLRSALGATIDVLLITTDPAFVPAGCADDAVADIWHIQHFGTLASSGPGSDTDGDGMLDSEEYLAGTDPTDSASASTLTIDLIDGAPVVRFVGIPAGGPAYQGLTRRYTLERSTDLSGSDWEPVLAVAPLNIGEIVYRAADEAAGFFRTRIVLD